MTLAKATALTLGFLGAFAVGVWVGPNVREYTGDTATAHVAQSSDAASKPRPAATAARGKTAAKSAAVNAPDAILASAANVHDQVKPLLNRGANVTMASEGFRDAEQFVTVAHAARNTEIPFMLLKHRVLTEGKSLTAAIRESKPDVDAAIEANRARAEAKSDIAKLRG